MFIHIGYFSCRPFSINRVCLTIQQKLVLLSHNGIIQKVHVNVTALSSPIYHKENPSFTTYLAQLHNRPFYSLWLAPPDWCNQLKTWGFHFIHQNPFVQHISTFFCSLAARSNSHQDHLQNLTKPHRFILPRPSSSHFPHIWFQSRHLPANIKIHNFWNWRTLDYSITDKKRSLTWPS